MTIDDAIKKIDRYLDSNRTEPRIVDVPNADVASDIKTCYNVGKNLFIDASNYADKDSLPRIDEILNALSTSDKPVFLFGLSTMLKMLGKEELVRVLTVLVNFSPKSKLVVLTYGCRQYLKFRDSRIKDKGQLILIDGEEDTPCKINFITHDLAGAFDSTIDGISKLSTLVESGLYPDINVVTNHRQEEFPTSLLELRNRDSAYQIIAGNDSRFATLKQSMGKPEQWQCLLSLMRYDKWEDIINAKFGGTGNLTFWIDKYSDADDIDKWLYFLALKTIGSQNNEYLARVIGHVGFAHQLPASLFNCILDYNLRDRELFDLIYMQRKALLRHFDKYLTEASNFCKKVLVKGREAIHYLTDTTQPEKELVFELIEKNREAYTRTELLGILQTVYPALSAYLIPYHSGNVLLDEYIAEYKWCKVENKISHEHRQLMEVQATRRDYNALPPRASIIHNSNTKKALAYFVDAMGIEHLSYLQTRCSKLGLALTIKIGRCELPSLTSCNKEFVDTLSQKGVTTIDIKDLDDIKHEGLKGYDYTATKLPIHLIAELDVIDRLLQNAIIKLGKDYQRVLLVSDHGASRLAVINENEQQHEMQEKGQHSGRCCPSSEIDTQPEEATLENGFWCLANYDRFRGGRRASVEVHGGASIEEVVIPIVELTKIANKIECHIPEEYLTIYVSFKKKAALKLYVSEICDKLNIVVNNKVYHPARTEDKYFHYFELPDIRRAGDYKADVYDGDNIIARNLIFTVKKEGASERSFF